MTGKKGDHHKSRSSKSSSVRSTTAGSVSKGKSSHKSEHRKEETAGGEKISYDNLDIKNELGAGSSGAVVRVSHKVTGQEYAMKTMCKLDDRERRQVLQEIRTLHASSHPSIVGFVDAFYADGRVCILLELMDASLLDVVEHVGFIPELIMAKLTEPLLQGLRYLHKELHIVHRDIKPANILINSKGEVKIADFGVSGKMASTIGLKQTFVGTTTYMSPERILGTPHTSNSDIWSLGLTIMQCLLGRYPYGVCAHFFDLLDLIQESPSPSLPLDQFSSEMCSLSDQCLIKDPSLRPGAEQLLQHPLILKTRQDTDTNVTAWILKNLPPRSK